MNVALRTPRPPVPPMTRDEFLAWADVQEERYEFDGVGPVAMTGGSLGHSDITGNINRHLRNRLEGMACRALGLDAGVATVGNAVRYPDAVVTCSKYGRRDRLVPNPVVVFEVVSPSSVMTDRVEKLREYAAVASIRRYLIVEQVAPAVTVYSRGGAGEAFMAAGAAGGAVLGLPEIGIELPLACVYDGIEFDVVQES